MEGTPNWIPYTNRYNLPEPPKWFLGRLYAFDPMLVLVPSTMDVLPGATAKYLLCRRRQHSVGLGDKAMLDNKHPDTNMCIAHDLVPIAPLMFRNNGNTFTEAGLQSLIAELRARDTWAVSGGPQGNADAVADAVEAAEDAAEQRDRANLRDMFYHRARDAWRSMQARAGYRNKRASDYHGVARPQNGTAAK